MIERRRAAEAVLLAVLDGDKVLLQQRKNTGWMDSWYDLPSGHIDSGESVQDAGARELYEEVGLKVQSKNLELFHVSQSDAGANAPYTYFVFRAHDWEGEPVLGEPDLAENLDFYPLEDLPEKTVPYVRRALGDIAKQEVTFAYFGPDPL